MRKRFMVIGLLAIGMAGCSSMHRNAQKDEGDEGNEQKIAFAQVPPAAQKTLNEQAMGNAIDSVDKEMDNGKTVYEADVMIGGKNHEVKVTGDGTLISNKLDQEDDKGKKTDKEEDEKTEQNESK